MKTRKLLAAVLTIAMLVSLFSVPAFAEGEVTVVTDLSILIGDGDGVTDAYLAKTASKLQGAMVTLRLLGLGEIAENFEGTDTFKDAGDAKPFWAPVLAYLKVNPEVGFDGNEDGTFAVSETLTAQMFNKVLLTMLGYVQGIDFTWEDTNAFAASVGLTVLAGKTDLINEDIAVSIVEALGLDTVDGITLISKLVADGAISKADAIAAGFTVETITLAITDAYASGLKEITVATNTEIPEDATITLKKGTVGLNVETIALADDMMSATLTGYFTYAAGTYTVMVDEASYTFAVEAEMAVDLQMGADFVYKAAAQDLLVKLSNQYGEAMSLTGATVSVINVTDSGSDVNAVATTTIKVDASSADTDDELFVFVYDQTSMKSVQGTVIVKAAPELTSLAFGDVTITDDEVSIFQDTNDHVLEVMAVDQYGNAFKLTSAIAASDITFITSNQDTLDTNISDMQIDADGNIIFDADDAGNAALTAIITAKGFIATSMPIKVWANPTLTTVEITGATEGLYVNEVSTLAAVGYDQYGVVIALDDTVTFTSTNLGILPTMAGAAVKVTPVTSGSATVFYYLNNVLVSSFTLEVNAKAIPTIITAMDVTDALQTGAYVMVDTSKVATVVDQYGRVMTEESFTDMGYDVMITSSTAASVQLIDYDLYKTNVLLGERESTYSGATYKFVGDGEKGSDTFKAYLTTNSIDENTTIEIQVIDKTPIESSVYSFTVKNIPESDIISVEMADVPTMYSGDAKESLVDQGTIAEGSSINLYDETIIFTGKTAEGDTVLLLDDDFDGVPDMIDVITTSSDTLTIRNAVLTASGEAGIVTVKAFRDGEVLDAIDVILSDIDPYVAVLAYTITSIEMDEVIVYVRDFSTLENDAIGIVKEFTIEPNELDELCYGSNLVIKDQYDREISKGTAFGSYVGFSESTMGNLKTQVHEFEKGYRIVTWDNDADTLSITHVLKDGSLSTKFIILNNTITPEQLGGMYT